jgi:hypothetical protein
VKRCLKSDTCASLLLEIITLAGLDGISADIVRGFQCKLVRANGRAHAKPDSCAHRYRDRPRSARLFTGVACKWRRTASDARPTSVDDRMCGIATEPNRSGPIVRKGAYSNTRAPEINVHGIRIATSDLWATCRESVTSR